MKTEQQYFEDSQSMQEYMEAMSQLKEQSFAIYESFTLPKEDAFIEQLKNANVHMLAITEDWCGDAMINNPIIRKVAEAANNQELLKLLKLDRKTFEKVYENKLNYILYYRIRR